MLLQSPNSLHKPLGPKIEGMIIRKTCKIDLRRFEDGDRVGWMHSIVKRLIWPGDRVRCDGCFEVDEIQVPFCREQGQGGTPGAFEGVVVEAQAGCVSGLEDADMSLVVGGGDVCWVELVDEAAQHDVAHEVEGVFFVGHIEIHRCISSIKCLYLV